jgi:hypothetical protein
MRSVANPALRRSASLFEDEVLGSVDGVDFVAGDGLVALR